MFKIYFFSAFRSFLKHKSTSLINILGLTLGLTAFLFIIHYIVYERSYDTFFDGHENVYRINMKINKADEVIYNGARTPRAMYFALQEGIQEVESNTLTYFESCLIKYKGLSFSDQKVLWVDDEFEKVFPIKFIRGFAEFARPLTGVISESKAKSIFGDKDPIGKIMKVNEGIPVEITGIYEDMPSNTHLDADFFVSIRTFVHYGWISPPGEWEYWAWWNYVKLKDNTSPEDFEATLNSFVDTHMGFLKDDNRTGSFKLQPLADLHFIRGLENEFGASTNEKSLHYLLTVAVFTLLIAWINYVNLATAQSIKRSHQIGLRKLIGATKMHMWFQSLVESLLMNFLAIALALIAYLLLLHVFSVYFQLPLTSAYVPKIYIFGFLTLAFVSGIVFSSLYISISLFDLNPLKKDGIKSSKGGFKQGLVIAQLGIAIVFISGTLMVYKQINFMRQFDLGMYIDNVITLSAPASTNIDSLRREKYLAFREDLLQHPEFISGVSTMRIPGQTPRWTVEYTRPDAKQETRARYILNNADDGMIETYSLKLLAGRNFSKNPADNSRQVIINRQAALMLGFNDASDAVGRIIYDVSDRETGNEIIGVVNDFHNEGLHKASYPMVWNNHHPYEFGYYSINVNAESIGTAIQKMERIWESHFPKDPFTYTFANEYFNKQYESDVRFWKFYIALTFLSIFISCLGIYGLLIFYLAQKNKEIGVRKVNGAKVSEILTMLNKDFIRWVIIAFAIGAPIAYYAMNKWLENFAYKTELSWWIFALAGLLALGIALLTVSWQSWKAATRNPVEALR